jgi:hypothetical protein
MKLHALHRSVVPIGMTLMLGLCNPPRRGRVELAKHGLLYPLVWIPCYDTISKKLGSRNRVGSVASDLESWVTCCDVIPHSEIAETKPPYVCPGCFIHTYSNNTINRCHIQ